MADSLRRWKLRRFRRAMARSVPVVCFAHVTNTLAQHGGDDFEKGEADGTLTATRLIDAAVQAFRLAAIILMRRPHAGVFRKARGIRRISRLASIVAGRIIDLRRCHLPGDVAHLRADIVATRS